VSPPLHRHAANKPISCHLRHGASSSIGAISSGHAPIKHLNVSTGSISQLLSRIGGCLPDDALSRKNGVTAIWLFASDEDLFQKTIPNPGVRNLR